MKDKKVEGEDFILKKIRHYQGTIADYETFWNQKMAEGEKEISPETKACAAHNAELNKAFEIVPISNDADNESKPLTPAEIKKAEDAVEKEDEHKKDDKKSDDKSEKSKKDNVKDDKDSDDKKKKDKKDKKDE